MGRWEKDVPREDLEAHRLLFACFRSEQMSLAQLYEHMKLDAGFRDYVLTQVWIGDAKRDGV